MKLFLYDLWKKATDEQKESIAIIHRKELTLVERKELPIRRQMPELCILM